MPRTQVDTANGESFRSHAKHVAGMRDELPDITRTLKHTELPEDTSHGRLTTEWNFYRQIVSRLLAEGHAGHWLLIKNSELIGIWESEEEVNRIRLERFLLQDVLMKQICEQESLIRGWEYRQRCH